MAKEILRIGRVIEVSGSRVVGELEASVADLYRTFRSRRYSIGQIGSVVRIDAGDKLVFGIVTSLRMAELPPTTDNKKLDPLPPSTDMKWLEIELFGEGVRTGLEDGSFNFKRGIVCYPLPGQSIYVANVQELERIYRQPDKPSLRVGTLSQASSLPVHLLADEILGKHFAVLGTTGSGKSCSVTVLLNAILNHAPASHVILLDPHAEYARAFAELAEIIDPTGLKIPHWLLNFEESTGLFVGEHVATSQTNILKEAILQARKSFLPAALSADFISVDTPSPYRLGDLVANVNAKRPNNNSKNDHAPFDKIINKIESLQRDKRFNFLMLNDDAVFDVLPDLMSRYLRIPCEKKPLSIIDLSGVPSDVVDVVVSVLCRIVFDFAVWSPRPPSVPILLVCEEAHRYAPRRDDATFKPAKQALSRIAKEGRKYGVALGLVTQRPSELDETILSQCNTLVALRMSNEQDQSFVKRSLPDTVRSLVDALPTLRTQEALVVGEGTIVPLRLRFDDLPADRRPQSADVEFTRLWQQDSKDLSHVTDVVRRWRMQERSDSY